MIPNVSQPIGHIPPHPHPFYLRPNHRSIFTLADTQLQANNLPPAITLKEKVYRKVILQGNTHWNTQNRVYFYWNKEVIEDPTPPPAPPA